VSCAFGASRHFPLTRSLRREVNYSNNNGCVNSIFSLVILPAMAEAFAKDNKIKVYYCYHRPVDGG
jgi:hypothetical protein